MRFQLVSFTDTKFDDDVYEVIVPAEGGSIAILADHMPLISSLAPGVVSVRKHAGDNEDKLEHFAVGGGVVETDGKITHLLSDEVVGEEEVIEHEAEQALSRAQELVAGAKTQLEFDEARKILQHSHARLYVAQIRKRRHH